MAEAGLIDEIFVALGLKVDNKVVKDFKGNIDKTVGSMKTLATVAVGAITVLDRMTNALMKANQAYISFNQQTGISIDAMNRVANASMLANYNMSPQAVMSSIQSLQSNLAAIKLGQGNIAPFQMLGISPIGKDAIQVVEELRNAISGLDDMTATNMIQQMGLSPEFMSYLRMSTEEIQMLNAAAQQFTLTARERKDLQSFALQIRLVHMEMSYLKDKALIDLAPALMRLLHFFTNISKVLIENKTLLVWLGTTGVVMIMGMNKSIKILGITINRTFGKWLAILTALLLILEDIAVYKEGGLSAIGDLLGLKEKVKDYSKDRNKVIQDAANNMGTKVPTHPFYNILDFISGSLGLINHKFDIVRTFAEKQVAPNNNTQNQTINQTNYLNMGQGANTGSTANTLTQQLYNAMSQLYPRF